MDTPLGRIVTAVAVLVAIAVVAVAGYLFINLGSTAPTRTLPPVQLVSPSV